MGERITIIRKRMREERGVEVERNAIVFRPLHPVGEMFGADLVAVNDFAVRFGIDGVEVETLLAGDEREGLFGVFTEHVRRDGGAGVVANGHDAAAGDGFVMDFEAFHIVALPAVEGDGGIGERGQRGIRVNTDGLVEGFRAVIAFLDDFGGKILEHVYSCW